MNYITILLWLVMEIRAQGLAEIYFTTNPVVESTGVAGAELLLTRFNHITSSRDFSDSRLKAYFTVNRGWYSWSLNRDSKFYYYHVSKGFRNTTRLGMDLSILRLPENKQTGEYGETIRTIKPYYASVGLAYTSLISKDVGVGSIIQLTHIDFGSIGAGAERTDIESTFFSFYVGITKFGLFKNLTLTQGILTLPEEFQLRETHEDNGIALSLSILNMGSHISFSSIKQEDPQPQRMLLGFSYKFINSSLVAGRLFVTLEKLLISFDKEKEKWDPFYKALFTGWSNDSQEMEKKDIIYRFGTEVQLTKHLVLRFGKYRNPKLDDNRWYDGTRKDYKYSTWGFTLHSPFLSVSGAFLNSELPVNPWEAKVSLEFHI